MGEVDLAHWRLRIAGIVRWIEGLFAESLNLHGHFQWDFGEVSRRAAIWVTLGWSPHRQAVRLWPF